jgi:hypothetical protein
MLSVAKWSPVPSEPVKTVFQERQTGNEAHGRGRVRDSRFVSASARLLSE